MKAKSFLESAGLAVLYTLPIANAFLNSWHLDSFHHPYPVTSIPRAMLLLTLLVWALAWLIVVALDRLPPRVRNLVSIALPTLLIWLLGRVGAGIFNARPVVVGHILLASHIGVAVVPILLLVLWRLRPTALQQTIDATRVVFTIAAFGMLILLPKLAWQALRVHAREQTSFTNPSLPTSSSPQPRIVWILMDELSYDQVFGHRPSGLSFPNFDQFARQSTTFSDLQPTGYLTEEVVPGLLIGRTVADVDRSGKAFRFRSVKRGPWHPYDVSHTVFGDARQLGWTTGIAGWYNPYCRLLQSVLDRCSWQYSAAYPGLPWRLFYDGSTFANFLALLQPHERIDQLTTAPSDHDAHVRDYRDVMTQAQGLLHDQRIRFVMLHLPVPHPPGIYDRKRHALTAGGNYIDNLVLADDTLGQLMKVIQAT
ncbi:MAG TPA: hypothetical protein VE218_10740, partial [Acidobacteriaceae bacterium]|nr:hypothetical protein [Acidobacteriaceae bacterium]